MKPLTLRTAIFLAVDIALFVICALYVPSLLESAGPPFEAVFVGDAFHVMKITDQRAAGMIALGDRIVRWDDTALLHDHDVEFLCAYFAPGDTVLVTLQGGQQAKVIYVHAFDSLYIVIVLCVGIFTWGLGVFVQLSRPRQLAAGTLHWSLVCMGVSTIMTSGRIFPGEFLPYLFKAVFLAVYIGIPSLFLFFTSIFPRPKYRSLWPVATASFLPGALLYAMLTSTLFSAMRERSLILFQAFQTWYDIFHAVLILYFVAGLVSIIESYRRAETLEDRKKLEWILWGLTLGPTPFLFFDVFPELLHRQALIPEELATLFFLLIPVSFSIAFVKYHVLDIEVVIKRTTVYAVVVGVVIGLYVLVVSSVSALVGAFLQQTAVAAAVGVALLFEPFRVRVQRWVDRRFFRVHYDFRETGRSILEAIGQAIDEQQLGEIVIQRMDEVIPVERIILMAAESGTDRMHVLGQRGGENLTHADASACGCGEIQAGIPSATERAFEAGVDFTPISSELAGRMNVVAVFPMVDENQRVHGCLALGGKKSAVRFRTEDVDLLMQVAAETELALQRIRLQRRLLLEQAAALRLTELNQMKSDFVSYVSHELRTPLTSIKMFSEILRSPRLRLGRTARDYIRVIEGESDRLGRMVTTVLDSAKIEQGVKEYRLAPVDLRRHVAAALETMAFQLKQNQFAVRLIQPRVPLPVLADGDAVVQAVVNLVANTIKYAGQRKRLTVVLESREGSARCSVRDRGRGIPPEVIPHLFERFYRAPDVRRDVQGVGLGLPLVKHIMDAHNGTVEVTSEVGEGSTFTLLFPLIGEQRSVNSSKGRTHYEYNSRH
ncbi:MAG TPA: ATP-binding protein [Bacteroidota bacterium]|nr:ATP-binding protein [Bacteroidota bacterium]